MLTMHGGAEFATPVADGALGDTLVIPHKFVNKRIRKMSKVSGGVEFATPVAHEPSGENPGDPNML